MELNKIADNINQQWDDVIIPLLCEYVEIPCKSVAFDPDWRAHGHIDRAMDLMQHWCEAQPIRDMTVQRFTLDNRTPVLCIDIPGTDDHNILVYGHMDKQPEMAGWDEDLGPWRAVIKDNKLYGRGGADDGYAIFSILSAIRALQENGHTHPRCFVLIESCEESGSADLPFYLEALAEQIGVPTLVLGLDSGAGNYEQLWSTTSLRGVINATLSVKVLKKGAHSGWGSGVVPNPVMILRHLLDRVQDSSNGKIVLDALQADIPQQRIDQAKQAADILGLAYADMFYWEEGVKPLADDTPTQILNKTWRSTLSLTGIDGIPSTDKAGNVTLPHVTAKLSFRVPPTLNADDAAAALQEVFTTEPPFDAKVSFTVHEKSNGWHAPPLADWLAACTNDASNAAYNAPAAYLGEGGSIPFMGMLGDKFPNAQFLITGVLGPKSNAHGPNEFLHLPYTKKLTAAIAHLLSALSH